MKLQILLRSDIDEVCVELKTNPGFDVWCVKVFDYYEAAVELTKNLVAKSNSKHIDIRYHFLRELGSMREFNTFHVLVASAKQYADFLTKPP